jgi:hypothetical protein
MLTPAKIMKKLRFYRDGTTADIINNILKFVRNACKN